MAQELQDIDGLGSGTARKLRNVGVKSLEDLSQIDPDEISDKVSKMSASRLRKFQKEAKRNAVTVMTGEEVAQEYDDLTKVSTGINEVDDILGGGWESGFIVAVAGPTGSGKTQITFQSLGEAVKDQDRPAVYIETERGRYRGNRIREMFDEDTQHDVHKIPAYGLDQQELAYEKVKEAYDHGDISCVVVDSFTARFRMSDKFQGRSDLPDRSEVMARHLDKLDELAAVYEVPVLLTCQISGNPDQYGSRYNIYGGSLMHHMVNFVVMMNGKQGALTELEIRNHPEVEDQSLDLQINEDGVGLPQ